MDGKMVLNEDFREFIQSLNDNRVRYLVIGGYAVAFHGHPRYTKDIDIWLELSAENADRMVKALEQFGFASLGLKCEDFLVPAQIIQLGYPPNRIDLLTSLENMDFQKCYDSRSEVTADGVKINFIDLPNLRKSKKNRRTVSGFGGLGEFKIKLKCYQTIFNRLNSVNWRKL